MFLNNLKIGIRNIKKNKWYSFINIFGLAVGITCCILIVLYIQNELSYDKYNNNFDRLYRVRLEALIGSKELNIATSCAPCGATFTTEIPEVVNYTRIRNYGFPVLRYNDKAFSEERFFNVDSTFFDVFTVKFLEGNPKTALNKPHTVVITESMAKKYFGNEDPMGKILTADRRNDYLVTGVIKDVPQNSSFHFDFLGSIISYPVQNDLSWLSNNFYTYLLVKKGVNQKELEDKIHKVTEKYILPQLKEVIGINSLEQLKASGNKYHYVLQPLSDIHLKSHLESEIEPNSDIVYIYIFSIIAFAILLIACINFTNLSTARSSGRAKEVGVRKTLGSNQALLIKQFLTETTLMSFIAMVLAILLVEIFLPSFNLIANKNLDFNIFNNFYSIPLLILFVLIVGFAAGIYPALVLSSFIPAKVLKGNSLKTSTKSQLRNILVTAQFVISIVLIAGTFIIKDQLSFIQNKKLGFNRNQILIIKKTDDIGSNIKPFKNDLERINGVENVTNSNSIPGENFSDSAYKLDGAGNENIQNIKFLYADYSFLNTYQIKMKDGRFFSREFSSDTTAVVINEAAAKVFGLKEPVDKYIDWIGDNNKSKIIGVTDNFNFESLHRKIGPLFIFLYRQNAFGEFISVRVSSQNIKNTIQEISDTWHKYAGRQEFEYSFFNDDFAKLYSSELRTAQIFSIFSALAIFIACLGLLGLAAFTAEQRTKEIGIRKVLGATVSEIIFMLAKDYTKWVIIANVIALPLAYFLMQKWLEDFAYRIDLSVLPFLFAGVIALIIALLTIAYQAVKAAVANPVKSLKYE